MAKVKTGTQRSKYCRERQAAAIDGAVEKKKANTKRTRDRRAAQKVAPVTDAGVPYEEEEDGGADEVRRVLVGSWLRAIEAPSLVGQS